MKHKLTAWWEHNLDVLIVQLDTGKKLYRQSYTREFLESFPPGVGLHVIVNQLVHLAEYDEIVTAKLKLFEAIHGPPILPTEYKLGFSISKELLDIQLDDPILPRQQPGCFHVIDLGGGELWPLIE